MNDLMNLQAGFQRAMELTEKYHKNFKIPFNEDVKRDVLGGFGAGWLAGGGDMNTLMLFTAMNKPGAPKKRK